MKLEECFERIDKYISTNDSYPRFINVDNINDMNAVFSHFNVGETHFVKAEKFAKQDNCISEAKLLNFLGKEKQNIFLTGLTSFYKLLGQEKLKQILSKLASTTYKTKIVVLCYQCTNELNFSDIRSAERVYRIDGTPDSKTTLIFSKSVNSDDVPFIDGINKIAEYIEHNNPPYLIVKTQKKKSDFQSSLLSIEEQGDAYQQLCELDLDITNVDNKIGSSEQWEYALNEIKPFKSLRSCVENKIIAINSLGYAFHNWNQFDDDKKWLYFLALKCFGVHNNPYLNLAVTLSNKSTDLIENIFKGLLEIPHTDENFWEYYKARKELIKSLGELPAKYVSDYCQWTISKGKYAIYYLTDNSETEIQLLFKLFNDLKNDLKKEEVLAVLKEIYPALYSYLYPYDYKNELLNYYFNEYKYQKVMNYISPEFMKIVEEQAAKREYNAILPARSEKTEGIADEKTCVYFVDAMGAEYLSYLLAEYKANDLLANITLCHCEVPSLTCENKDFINVFELAGAKFANGKNEDLNNYSGYKKLDDLKHHGEESFAEYRDQKLPTYLAKELSLLSELISEIAKILQQGYYEKVIMISDHGASRLAVINNQELSYEMAESGKYSGRCCPKSETDTQPECATESDNYWVLANYGRFKGSRKGDVEVHGGATLEEVVIPIIEITKKEENYEFKLADSNIEFSKRKKNAQIKLFSKSKLSTITISIPKLNEKFDATSSDGHNFIIDLPNLKIAGTYKFSIYLNDNLLSDSLSFTAKNTDFGMNDKFKL